MQFMIDSRRHMVLAIWLILGMLTAGIARDSGVATNKYYYLKDHLGSTRVVIDQAGAVVESYDYYPFGLQMPRRSSIEGIGTRNLFSGKEQDEESGLQYFGARYYHPALGRWLTVDPLAHQYPELSPYAYGANNPVVNYDPDGKFLDTIADAGFVIYDIYDIAATIGRGDNVTSDQVIALVADVGGLFVPFATGAGAAYKGVKQTGKAIKSADKASETVDKAQDAEKILEQSEKGGYLFRGDGQIPDQVHQGGFEARGESTDILAHAINSASPASAYVSTSKKARIAKKFAEDHDGYVYVIRPQEGIDVNKALGKASPYPYEKEIAVPGSIDPTDILGAVKVGPEGEFVGSFVKNPNFKEK